MGSCKVWSGGLVAMLCLGTATAKEWVTFDAEDFNARALAAFERAVGMSPAVRSDGNQVRVWYDSVMNGRVTGYLVVPDGARRCRLKYDNNGEGIRVARGDCGSLKRHPAEVARVFSLLGRIAELDGQHAACDGVMDGWSGAVSGVIDGRRFEFYIGNNDQCNDARSLLVTELTDAVGAAYEPDRD